MGETGEDGLQIHEDRGFARTSGSCATGNLA